MAPNDPIGRRGFLQGAGAAAAGFAMAPPGAAAQSSDGTRSDAPAAVKPGSDFMVDVLRSLDFEYCALNPGSSFRGLQESFINYSGNTKPELLTCLHEEASAA